MIPSQPLLKLITIHPLAHFPIPAGFRRPGPLGGFVCVGQRRLERPGGQAGEERPHDLGLAGERQKITLLFPVRTQTTVREVPVHLEQFPDQPCVTLGSQLNTVETPQKLSNFGCRFDL